MFRKSYFLVIYLIFIIKFQNIKCNQNLFTSGLFTSGLKNVYYIESDYKFTWFDAIAKCASMNMSLITLDTKEKSDDVTTLLKDMFGKKTLLWMGGLTVGNNPTQLVWISTGKKFTYTNWAATQPDFLNNQEYCAQIGWTANMEWNDHECSAKFGFMCEYSRYHFCEDKLQQVLQEDVEKQKKVGFKQSVGEIVRDCKTTEGENKTFRDIIFNINPYPK